MQLTPAPEGPHARLYLGLERCFAYDGRTFDWAGAAPHLDRSYTIFGECGPESAIEKLVGVEVRGDRSVNPTKIEKVTIKRKATTAKAAASAKAAK